MMLQNKQFLITGGTSGIGLALVRKLAEDNRVIVISRSGTLPDELTTGKNPVDLYHADLASKTDVEGVFDQIQRRYTSLDVLINNAAVQSTPELLSDDFNYDAIQTEIAINFTAICQLTYLCLPLLQAAEQGLVLNVNSGLAIVPKQGSAIYCATKSALDSFSKSLEYQLKNTSIDVQQAFLPLVDTAMTQGRGSGKLSSEVAAQRIIAGITHRKPTNDIGKVKLLRAINTVMPPLARRIMRGA